jgi:uncharacterized membrane protein YdjX (TVP38/TMEM64 family)
MARKTLDPEEGKRGSRLRCLCLVLVIVGIVAALVLVGRNVHALLENLAHFVAQEGSWAAVVCALLFVPWIMACLPSTVLELLMGYLFGFFVGGVINFAGKLFGSTLAYAAGNTILKVEINRRLSDSWRWQAVQSAVRKNPRKLAFLLRMAYIPIGLKNYGVSVLDDCVGFRLFLATVIAVDSVTSFMMSFMGSTARSLADVLAGKTSPGGNAVSIIMLVVTTVSLFLLLSVVGVWAKNNLMVKGSESDDNIGDDQGLQTQHGDKEIEIADASLASGGHRLDDDGADPEIAMPNRHSVGGGGRDGADGKYMASRDVNRGISASKLES